MQLIIYFPACSKCVPDQGQLTCCGTGGSWFLKCGLSGDPNFEHTWDDGLKACATEKTLLITPKAPPTLG